MRPTATGLLALLLALASPAAAQWSTQSPVPTYLDIRGIAAPTAQHVFIATADGSFDDGGALFESADGGASWVQRDVPVNLNDPLNGILFLDSQRGWAYGNRSYRTTDGGTTWEELPLLGTTDAMVFYTPAFGYASNGGPLVSRDGGLSWSPAPNGLFAFDFADQQVGLGASAEGLYRTTDGGATFALVQAGEAEAVAFLSPQIAIGIVDGTFVRSTDGGATWTAGASADGRSGLVVVSPNVVLAWGRTDFFPNGDARLLRSTDGGQTWTDLGEVIGAGTQSFAAPDAQTVVALDVTGDVFRSADAGQTWTQTFASPGPRPNPFGAIQPAFGDAQTGYIGYGDGFVIKTTDGGVTWAQISSGYGETLNGINRFADGSLIAVGEFGTVLTSADGVRWALGETPTQADFEAVDVVGPQSVVAVDRQGRLYRSVDGGASWTAGTALPLGLDARDLDFDTLLDGWVAGLGSSAGAVFHTTDGGDSWTSVPDFSGSYVAVDFEGGNGWAANVGGRYYYSTDDGASWTQGELPDMGVALQIQDMDFANATTGYAVGRQGYAARSADGGVTWDILPTPNGEAHFTDLDLLGPDELWVSTNDGVVYYSATGGQNWTVLDTETEGFGSFAAIAATPEGDAWAVGFQGYIEHFSGPPGPPLNRPPVASFEFETSGLSVDFTDTSTDPDGTVEGWLWTFGDGATSTEQHPSHTFAEANTYIVRLTVADDDGATGDGVRFLVVQTGPGGTFGSFTEVTPLDPLFVTPQDEDFWVATTAPADFDGDGDLDIAVLGYYVVYGESVDERLVLLRNEGAASPEAWAFAYVDVPLGDLSTGASDLAWGDLDGDGDQDLVVGSNGATVIYRNDDGTLALTDTPLPGYFEDNDQADFDLQSITLADYDNDGDLDLLLPSVLGASGYRTALLRNDGLDGAGSFVFTETNSTFAPTGHAQSLWADYDGDDDLDLLLVHLAPLTDDGFIRRYRNDGGGTFVGEDVLGGLTIEHGEARWGDYDADGDYDILIAGNVGEPDGTFGNALRVYENDGDTFTPFDVIDCIPCEGWFDFTAATWADYDADGDVDILLTGTHNPGTGQIEGRARIYTNDGGTFTDAGEDLPAPRAAGTRGGTFSWLDIDGEGDLDYFIAGDYWVPGGNGLVEAQMHLYRYDATGSNAAPSRPAGMQAAVDDATGTVTLSVGGLDR